jgi:hypothetical protein
MRLSVVICKVNQGTPGPEEKVLTLGVLLREDHEDVLNVDSTQTSELVEC